MTPAFSARRSLVAAALLLFVAVMPLNAVSAHHNPDPETNPTPEPAQCNNYDDKTYLCLYDGQDFLVCFMTLPVEVYNTWYDTGIGGSGNLHVEVAPHNIPSCFVNPENLHIDPLGGTYGCENFSPAHPWDIRCTAWGKWVFVHL